MTFVEGVEPDFYPLTKSFFDLYFAFDSSTLAIITPLLLGGETSGGSHVHEGKPGIASSEERHRRGEEAHRRGIISESG